MAAGAEEVGAEAEGGTAVAPVTAVALVGAVAAAAVGATGRAGDSILWKMEEVGITGVLAGEGATDVAGEGATDVAGELSGGVRFAGDGAGAMTLVPMDGEAMGDAP